MMDDKKIEEVAKVYMIGEFYDRDEAEWNYPITNWDDWYEVGDLVNAFESLEEIENLIKNLKKKFSSKEWKVEIRRNY